MEVKALQAQGWTVSAIARHLGVTRLTVRRYLNGERTPGQRARTVADPFEEFVEYCRLRLAADPHVWAATLFEEVVASVTTAPIRRSPGRSARGGCGRGARRVGRASPATGC